MIIKMVLGKICENSDIKFCPTQTLLNNSMTGYFHSNSLEASSAHFFHHTLKRN